MRKSLLLTFGLLLVACSHAQVGKWSGKVAMNLPSPKSISDPAKRKELEELISRMKQYRIGMDFRADKTVTMSLPKVTVGGRTNPGQVATGTWSIKGNTISVLLTKNDGKPIPKEQMKAQPMTLSADKKRIVMTGGTGSRKTTVTFTRG
jgi:hypothetical protein